MSSTMGAFTMDELAALGDGWVIMPKAADVIEQQQQPEPGMSGAVDAADAVAADEEMQMVVYTGKGDTLVTIAKQLNRGLLSTKSQKRVTAKHLLALNKLNIPGLSIRAELQEGTRIVTDGNAFECEHCDFDGATEGAVNAHERICSRNPANVSHITDGGGAGLAAAATAAADGPSEYEVARLANIAANG
eukprot:gene24546-25943_t